MTPPKGLQEKPGKNNPESNTVSPQAAQEGTSALSPKEMAKMRPTVSDAVPTVTLEDGRSSAGKVPAPDGKLYDSSDQNGKDKPAPNAPSFTNATLYWNNNQDGSKTGMTRFNQPTETGEIFELHWDWDKDGQHPSYAMKIATDRITGDTTYTRFGSYHFTKSGGTILHDDVKEIKVVSQKDGSTIVVDKEKVASAATNKITGPDGKLYDSTDKGGKDKPMPNAPSFTNATLYWNNNKDGSKTGMTRFDQPNSAGETIELHWQWDQTGQHRQHAIKISTDATTKDTTYTRIGSYDWTALHNNIEETKVIHKDGSYEVTTFDVNGASKTTAFRKDNTAIISTDVSPPAPPKSTPTIPPAPKPAPLVDVKPVVSKERKPFSPADAQLPTRSAPGATPPAPFFPVDAQPPALAKLKPLSPLNVPPLSPPEFRSTVETTSTPKESAVKQPKYADPYGKQYDHMKVFPNDGNAVAYWNGKPGEKITGFTHYSNVVLQPGSQPVTVDLHWTTTDPPEQIAFPQTGQPLYAEIVTANPATSETTHTRTSYTAEPGKHPNIDLDNILGTRVFDKDNRLLRETKGKARADDRAVVQETKPGETRRYQLGSRAVVANFDQAGQVQEVTMLNDQNRLEGKINYAQDGRMITLTFPAPTKSDEMISKSWKYKGKDDKGNQKWQTVGAANSGMPETCYNLAFDLKRHNWQFNDAAGVGHIGSFDNNKIVENKSADALDFQYRTKLGDQYETQRAALQQKLESQGISFGHDSNTNTPNRAQLELVQSLAKRLHPPDQKANLNFVF